MNLTRKERQDLLLGRASPAVFRRYYKTTHWMQIRDQKLARNPVCQLCRHRKATTAHHKNYACLFNEHLDRDLDSVCNACHRKISR